MKDRNLKHSDNWQTPNYIMEPLYKEFGKMFDPCPLNHDIDDWDGLKIDWHNVNFINPPYSRKLKDAFVKKAIRESQKGKKCILLIPVSTSTILFHDYILPNAKDIRFIKKRIKFIGYNTKGELVKNKCGMHDSMIVIL
tara:strand:- start:47 stop:463 length:417 start_codon:yes stop_codon:yes gene_type:complete